MFGISSISRPSVAVKCTSRGPPALASRTVGIRTSAMAIQMATLRVRGSVGRDSGTRGRSVVGITFTGIRATFSAPRTLYHWHQHPAGSPRVPKTACRSSQLTSLAGTTARSLRAEVVMEGAASRGMTGGWGC